MEIKEKINLKRLNSIFKKNILKIIAILFLFALCGYYYSYNIVVPKYKSTSTILLTSNNLKKDDNSVTQTDVTLNKNLISTYSSILKSNNVLGKVISNLNIDITEEELLKNIQIEEIEDTQIIKVSVANNNAIEAQKIVEELDNVFVEEIKQIYKMDNINIVDKASLEEIPYNVNHIRDIALFILVGIVCSGIVIFVIYLFDTSIKIEQDIEEFVGINVIGTVPKYKGKDKGELIVQNNSKSIISESLKTIRTNISFTKVNGTSRAILFTSCNSGEGKSWVASNMAVAYSQSNKNVLIVDSDMRKGRQHNIFKVKNTNGLSNCLKEINNNEEKNFEILEKYIQETSIPKVHILTIGAIPPNPSELLLSSKMENLIQMLKCVYDIVIIDGTPCNLVSDSIPVSRIADTTILVTESRKTKIEDLKNVIKSMQNAGANISGAILNKKDVKRKEYGKGYYYGEINDNAKIEIKRHSVKELIENRREYKEDIENIEEKEIIKNDNLEKLTEKIEELENKLLEIPNINLESYTKIVDNVRKIYENEIDKNKLANDIKENIVKNEVLKKLEENNAQAHNTLNEKLEELNYKNEIKGLISKVDGIEDAINNNETEEKIAQMISNMKQEQEEKLENLDSSMALNNIVNEMKKLNSKYETIQNIEDTINSNDTEKNVSKMLLEMQEEQDRKLNELDNSKTLNNIIMEMQKLNSKYEKMQEIENAIKNNDTEVKINEMIMEMQEEQNRQIRVLDNSRALNNIIIEIQKLDRRYKKVEDIEKAITNDKTEERINKMLEKMKTDNAKKLEKIDNTSQIKEIMKELKKINTKYDKLAEKISKNNTNIKNTNTVKTSEKIKPVKDNIIEINELKDKVKKQEIIIEFGKEIDYKQLLDTAIETFEIKPNRKSKKA